MVIPAPVQAVAFSADGKLVATGSADQTVRVWDAATGRELQRLSDHHAAIIGVAIGADNASIVSAGADGSIRVWKPAAVRVFAGHEGPIRPLPPIPTAPRSTRPRPTGRSRSSTSTTEA